MTPADLHEYLARRTPIEDVPIDWDSSGYTSEVFNRWAASPEFPGWKGDAPTGTEASVIVELVGARPGDSMLDVACGYGRHATVLASRHDLRVTGVDISAGLVEAARRRAEESGLQIAIHRQDARRLTWTNEFDHAMIALNSFSLFSSEDALLVLRGIHRALKHGARLFMDLDNKPYVRRYGTSTNDWYLTPEGLTLQETYYHENLSVEVSRDMIITRGDTRVEEFTHFMRLYSLSEISNVLAAGGFPVKQAYGGWDLSSLDNASPKMLLVSAGD